MFKVVRHPNAREIPPNLQTTLLDITYEGETEPRALLSCGHAMGKFIMVCTFFSFSFIRLFLFCRYFRLNNRKAAGRNSDTINSDILLLALMSDIFSCRMFDNIIEFHDTYNTECRVAYNNLMFKNICDPVVTQKLTKL